MARIIIGAFVAAIVVFIWGFLAWPTLYLYDFAFGTLPTESVVAAQLRSSAPETGAYFIPNIPEDISAMSKDQQEKAMELWTERRKAGPLALVLYREEGADPNDPIMLVRGFAIMFVSALLLAGLIKATGASSFAKRFAVALGIALFAILVSHASNWNWFLLPDKYALAMSMDLLISWVLGGIVLAAIVKPPGTVVYS